MKRGFGNRHSNGSGRAEHATGHNLTSLVDCFAIILIYLLMATSFGEIDLEIPDGMKLPKAVKTEALVQNTIVQVRDGGYFMGGKPVDMSNLAEEFKRLVDEARSKAADLSKMAIVIQADQDASYGEINPVVISGLQAGFEEVQFAVLKSEEKL